MTRRLTSMRQGLGRSIYGALLLRLSLVFLIYSLVRCVFYVYNRDLIGVDTLGQLLDIFRGGLLFDASAIAYTNALVILLHILPLKSRYRRGYQRAINWVYWLVNIPAFVLNLGDVVYFRFTGRRTTLDVLNEFSNENPLKFLNFFWEYWPVTLIGLSIIGVWGWLYAQMKLAAGEPKPERRYYLRASLAFVLWTVLVFVASRGGISDARPILPTKAMQYVDRINQREVVLNTPFVLIRILGKKALPEYSFMSDQEARTIFDPIYKAMERPTPHAATLRGRNVVLIIWESMAREWVGALNKDLDNYEGYTPFIDSLMQHSYYFENAYAGGRSSIDAMPCLLASTPKPGVPFVMSPYSNNELGSIVRTLREDESYTTAYFHNAPTGSMGFDVMAKHLSYERYYGMEDFGDDREYDGRWGIWDEPFLQFFARTIGTLPEPFFATEFTTTSHSPYSLPEQYHAIYPDSGLHGIHRCIRYTDNALRKFFETARSQPWYMNTIFIITADHAVPGALDEYANERGLHQIPFIFFDPRGELVGRSSEVVQQADLVPTLLDLMGLERPMVTFGKSMFSTEGKHWAVCTISSGYQLIIGDYLMQYDGERVLAVYNYKDDPRLSVNLKDEPRDEIAEMLRFLQAYLQQYSERMRHNRLVEP